MLVSNHKVRGAGVARGGVDSVEQTRAKTLSAPGRRHVEMPDGRAAIPRLVAQRRKAGQANASLGDKALLPQAVVAQLVVERE